ncbi:alpha/beta hydrolase fold protein [Aspergillus ambiguus]|uniref:putative 6-hexanolactone hydrolase n=1 Tax=Aspergillus ambiguus TaxID=176160 RepID=UPI003CCD199C
MASNEQPLSFWERADLYPGQLAVMGAVLYNAVAGVFRGNSGNKEYKLHVANAMVRKTVTRLSPRQLQALSPSTDEAYEAFMKSKGVQPESVSLPHSAKGHWIGNKNAKKVMVYYHGGGFALGAGEGHFDFYSGLVDSLTANGHDVAIFFLSYALAPQSAYPTQLRQAVEALRYILVETGRAPADVIIGGDSAGGNLALAVLLHLTHPHPEIEPLAGNLAPLAGVVAFAPWVNFATDGKSMQENRYKDIIPAAALECWSSNYVSGKGKTGDAWCEPNRAPLEWWKGAKADHVLILAGGDEILFSSIDDFAKKFQTVVPNTTYVVGYGETHVAPVYSGRVLGRETQQGRELRRWLGPRL